ncbi:helix-turn-helix domain-containing protein [Salmonella enterica]|nr:helix-turn-helix domain-containing protein [Salmonella enterica]
MNTERNKNIAIELARVIEKRINENMKVNIEDATIISGYSKRQIQNIFKSATGLNIGKYIRKRILTKAAILVKLTRKKICHIAMDLHFSTQQHFNKAFSREFNCTPLEYRNSLYMDCSKLTPDFSADIPEYTLVKTEIKSFKLKTWPFKYQSGLLGNVTERGNSIRKRKILNILNKKKHAFIISHVKPSDTNELYVTIDAESGFIDKLNFNKKIDKISCCKIFFHGTWENYIKLGHFIFTITDVTHPLFTIEKFELTPKEDSFNINIYIPIVNI